ncbi:hypothetical protein FGO68_gene100 [Halteria grandinella]|uniref:CCDC113/CCDC96 coiled-coil domain-containing protein n=1 Tax=Halteria grandinella TaxID=5974 RepID=A0A8J8P064_HALGN|nr:hypothetical protein FGO68_gene100 [Halteria grandinella]
MDEITNLNQQAELRRELIATIEEAIREQEGLKKHNMDLQHQIMLMEPASFDAQSSSAGHGAEGGANKADAQQMNEHKYLNTLANVHQVRFNLKETQDRYNKMASELQAKLNEKQAKCEEIQSQFKELKRSVAQNAVYSRTGKKISQQYIQMKEQAEFQKDEEVTQFRLQNIALRNRLANKEKILKKKEQLADGLHLIDFEQLKIENQTLNEKIEERNEELHKLRKKITTTVVILSHTREKLQYVQEQNRTQNEKLKGLNDELNDEKIMLSKMKKDREVLGKENQKLRQQTGIVNKKSLKTDYDHREEEIRSLSERIIGLEEYHSRLYKVIDNAEQLQLTK